MKESFESTNNREDDKLRIPQLETHFAVQRKRDRFPLDRKVEILKFNQDILLAQLSTISTIVTLHHDLAYVATTKRSYFESMIPYVSTDPTVTTSTQKIQPNDWR